ncbi:MAG: hypothetical protein PVG38_13550 [Gammaproteobacteria bacterium]|jgi:hypothetical protein
MKPGHRISAIGKNVVVACWALLGVGAATADDKSNAKSEAVGNSAGDSPTGEQRGGVEHEDVLDRLFSPLDNAVSDINRDLNKGDNSSDNGSDPEWNE